MKLTIDPNGTWYHGSNRVFSELRENSTVTQWKAFYEALGYQCAGHYENAQDGYSEYFFVKRIG